MRCPVFGYFGSIENGVILSRANLSAEEHSFGKTALSDCTCEIGYYLKPKRSFPNETECYPCVTGMGCSDAGATLERLPLLPGFWRVANSSVDVHACGRIAAACLGGTQVGDASCHPSMQGPLCEVCAKGYHPGGGNGAMCVQCLGDEGLTIGYTIILIVGPFVCK